jgi:CRP/FNR family transcriptional regulator
MKNVSSTELRKKRFHNVLKNNPLFACLPEEALNEMEHIIVQMPFSRNQIILTEQDTPHYMYIIFSGEVKVVHISEDGDEHILAIHKAGDYFGEMALLDGKTEPATVIAMADETWIGFIAKADFEHYILNNQKMLKEIVKLLCLRLREAWTKLTVIRFGTAEDKVRAVLTLMSTQSGIQDQRGAIIPMRLTHSDIADYALVSRETVSRIMSKLKKSEKIEVLDNKYILLKNSFFNTSSILTS